MTHILISIKIFPKKIQKILYKRSNKTFNLIGNTNISKYYSTSVVQLKNKERLWLLKYEIQYTNLYS